MLYILNSNYEKSKPGRKKWFPIQIQRPRISLTELSEKENILNVVCYISLKMATFTYISMFNLKLWEN